MGLMEIIEKEIKLLERNLKNDLEPTKRSVVECISRLRTSADELEEQEIKVENPQFASLINNSKRILITSIKKESFIESSDINDYEDAIKFKTNLELLINRFGQVGDSHNRILNEFMRKQINKLKNEFDNLSSLLKDVTKIISVQESEMNKTVICKDDLVLFNKIVNERKEKEDRLSELKKEGTIIDKNIVTSKREYDDFQRSEEFLNTTHILGKINNKKNEIAIFEKNLMDMISNLSRPITKFSYLASKETQGRLATLQNEPLEILTSQPQYVELFGQLRKFIVDKSIQLKDPEKTIKQIDEIVNSLPSLSSSVNNLNEQLTQLESSVNSKNLRRLDDIQARTQMYEKYISENNSKMKETKDSINELDYAINALKKKIENNILDLTNVRYSIVYSDD